MWLNADGSLSPGVITGRLDLENPHTLVTELPLPVVLSRGGGIRHTPSADGTNQLETHVRIINENFRLLSEDFP